MADEEKPPPEDDRPMSLGEHLDELRKRLVWAIIWLGVGAVVPIVYYKEVIWVIQQPLLEVLGEEQAGNVISTSLEGPFFVALKACLVLGFFVSGPFALRELWKFVATGLYRRERRALSIFAPFSYLLFAAGGAFFYFVVQPVMLKFFVGYAGDIRVQMMPDIGEWFGLWLGMLFINGVAFQLPLVMLIAQMMGLTDWRTMAAYRRHFVVGSAVVAAVLTPTGDAVTLGLTMIPIVVLFEVGLVLCRILQRRAEKKEAARAAETTS